MRAIGKATGTTINDVVLAMCGGAMRSYLEEMGELPDTSMVSMVPVGLNAKQAQTASAEGGNAIGVVRVKLGTDLPDPADRPKRIKGSIPRGKDALSAKTPTKTPATGAIG